MTLATLIRRAALVLIAASPLLPFASFGAGDDADLFGSAGVPPNVLLSFDTSGSMTIWSPPEFVDTSENDAGCTPGQYEIWEGYSGFQQTGTYTCEGAQGGTAKIGYVPVTECGRERNIWVDPVQKCSNKSPGAHSSGNGNKVKYTGANWH